MLRGALTQHPSWSPDGSRIAGDVGGTAIFSIGVDGTNQRRLATAPAFYNDQSPDWSPEGTTLVFSESAQNGTSSALHVVGADGTGERQLTSGAFADYDPSWSRTERGSCSGEISSSSRSAPPAVPPRSCSASAAPWDRAGEARRRVRRNLKRRKCRSSARPTPESISPVGHDVVFYLCTSDFLRLSRASARSPTSRPSIRHPRGSTACP